MIDLLLVNPESRTDDLISALSVHNITVQIAKTSGKTFEYANNLNVIDLDKSQVYQDQGFISAIAFDYHGQLWLDSISNQIWLHNKPLVDRTANYLTSKFEVEFGKMFNILSYKGRHVIVDAFVYKDAKWNVIKDQTLPFFVNGVEDAFTFLDAAGILNGPSQVFIEPSGKVHVRLIPKAIDFSKTSTRNFLDIWPHLLTLEVEQPKKAILAFYSWVERTGPSKQFQLANGL